MVSGVTSNSGGHRRGEVQGRVGWRSTTSMDDTGGHGVAPPLLLLIRGDELLQVMGCMDDDQDQQQPWTERRTTPSSSSSSSTGVAMKPRRSYNGATRGCRKHSWRCNETPPPPPPPELQWSFAGRVDVMLELRRSCNEASSELY